MVTPSGTHTFQELTTVCPQLKLLNAPSFALPQLTFSE